jgi:hypothetical protein
MAALCGTFAQLVSCILSKTNDKNGQPLERQVGEEHHEKRNVHKRYSKSGLPLVCKSEPICRYFGFGIFRPNSKNFLSESHFLQKKSLKVHRRMLIKFKKSLFG